MRALLGVIAVAALLAPGGGLAGATVPPTDCGTIKVKATRYDVKSHRVSCRRARDWSRAYLARRKRPSGWRCDRYTDSALVFRCRRGGRDFFAVRRG